MRAWSEPFGRQDHILGRALPSSMHKRRAHHLRICLLLTGWLSDSCLDAVLRVSWLRYVQRRSHLSSRGPYVLKIFTVCYGSSFTVKSCLVFALLGRGHVRWHGGAVRRLPRFRFLVRTNHDENRFAALNCSYRAGHIRTAVTDSVDVVIDWCGRRRV